MDLIFQGHGCIDWFVVKIVSSQSKKLTTELDQAGPKSLGPARAGPRAPSKKSAGPDPARKSFKKKIGPARPSLAYTSRLETVASQDGSPSFLRSRLAGGSCSMGCYLPLYTTPSICTLVGVLGKDILALSSALVKIKKKATLRETPPR